MAEKHFESIDAPCVAQCTYSFTLNTTERIGHLLGLSFTNCGITLEADTSVPDPENPESNVNVVGVFDRIGWAGETDNPIPMTFRLSPKNRGTLQKALASPTGGTEIKAKWVIYDYSITEQKYFKHFHTDEKDINCKLTKGTMVNIQTQKDSVIQTPDNFVVTMTLTGNSKNEAQELSIAYEADDKNQLPFGTKSIS